MIRTCTLVAVLISSALLDIARGGELVECEPATTLEPPVFLRARNTTGAQGALGLARPFPRSSR